MCRVRYKGFEYDNGSFITYPCPTMDYVIVRTNDDDGAPCILGRTLEDGETITEYADRLMMVDGMNVLVLCEQLSFKSAQETATRFMNAFKDYEDVLKKRKPRNKRWKYWPKI